jgi:hypothetical protein
LLNPTDQVGDGFADQQHNVNLLRQLLEQEGNAQAGGQHQESGGKLPEHNHERKRPFWAKNPPL